MTNPSQTDQVLPVSQVAELVQTLVKAIRAFGLYLPNNPIYHRAIDKVRQQFVPIWSATDQLEFVIVETEMKWEEEVVYSNISKQESFAWTLYKDGLRTITFLQGVEETELVQFLEVIVKATHLPADAADDLLTMLWEQEFAHITYTYQDLLAEGEPIEASGTAPETPPQVVAAQVQEEAPPRPPGQVTVDDFDSTLYFLEEHEIEGLRRQIGDEYQRDLRDNVLRVLFDLLELQAYETVRTELITIVDQFLPYLLGAGDFRSVALILRESRVVLERARELTEDHRRNLDVFPDRLSSPDALAQLLRSIDEAPVPPSPTELGDLFREMRVGALQTLLEWLNQLTEQDVREVVASATERLAQAHPNELVAALGVEDEGVVRNAAKLAGRLQLAPAVAGVRRLLEQGDEELKLIAVEALAAIASPGALESLVPAVTDASREIRLAAVKVLSQRGHRNALGRVEEAIKGKALRDADLTERVAFFEAYGRIGGASVIPTLAPMLSGKGLFRKRLDHELRACAAMALGKVGTPEARNILESVAQDKDPLVRNAVVRALREGRE